MCKKRQSTSQTSASQSTPSSSSSKSTMNIKAGSCTTRFRTLTRVGKEMPSSPTSYAEIVNQLVDKATPRKAKALRSGTLKRKLFKPISVYKMLYIVYH